MFMRQRNDAGHDPLPFIGGNRKGDVLGADDRVSRERPVIVRETYVDVGCKLCQLRFSFGLGLPDCESVLVGRCSDGT